MKRLSPREEIKFLEEIAKNRNDKMLFDTLKESFSALHSRAQLVLSLITICLTITGFSGPTIAGSGSLAKAFLVLGLIFVLASAIVIMTGPLRLQWVSQFRTNTLRDTIHYLIQRRDVRTARYRLATVLLVIGLTGYVVSVIACFWAA